MTSAMQTIPNTPKKVLAYRRDRYFCPKCGGNNLDPAFLATSRLARIAAPKSCSYCAYDGTVSFAEMLALNAVPSDINKVFRFVYRSIDKRTDESFKTAEKLLELLKEVFAIRSRKCASTSAEDTDKFSQPLNEALEALDVSRREEFNAGQTKATTGKQQLTTAKRIADACDLGREASAAAQSIREKFDQPDG